MNKEIAKHILDELANARPVNTSNDISVSIHDYSWMQMEEIWFHVYSNLPGGGFTECSHRLFLSLADDFGIHVSVAYRGLVPLYVCLY